MVKCVAAGQQHLIVRSAAHFPSDQTKIHPQETAHAHTHTHTPHTHTEREAQHIHIMLCSSCARAKHNLAAQRNEKKYSRMNRRERNREDKIFEQSRSAYTAICHRVRCSGSFVSFYAATRPHSRILPIESKWYEGKQQRVSSSWVVFTWHFEAGNVRNAKKKIKTYFLCVSVCGYFLELHAAAAAATLLLFKDLVLRLRLRWSYFMCVSTLCWVRLCVPVRFSSFFPIQTSFMFFYTGIPICVSSRLMLSAGNLLLYIS